MVLVEQATQEVPSASGAAEVSPSGLPQKKARNKLFIKKDTSDDDQPPSRLEQIPLEILAEILAYAPNPSVILSLARCSKYFCHTLVNNPSTAFIWRNARERFELTGGVKLPAPTRNLTEASYAAFVFDFGHCEICGTFIRSMHTSFALRARICNNVSVLHIIVGFLSNTSMTVVTL